MWMFIETKAPGSPRSASAASPASCTAGLIVSFRLFPGLGRGRGQLPARSRLAQRVHLVARDPRRPAQDLVVGVLEPFLADDFARFECPCTALLPALLRSTSPAWPSELGGLVFVRVVADEDLFHRDAGELALVFFDVVDEVVADVVAQRDRRPGGDDFLFFGDPLPHPRQFHVHEFADFLQLGRCFGLVFGQLRGVDLERQAGPVVDQDFAVAGEDFAPRGDDLGRAGAVVLRLGEVRGAVDDLQRPEAEEEDREERHGEAADDRDPQRHAARPRPVLRSQVHAPYAPSTVGRRVRRTVASSTSAGRTRRRSPA